MVERLQNTFPDHGLMNAFSVFDSTSSKSQSTENDTDRKVDMILDHYGIERVNDDGVTLKPIVDSDKAKIEWNLLIHCKGENESPVNMLDIYVKNSDVYPNLAKLASYAIVMPTTSVSCERGISRFNYIKTDSRNTLNVETVDMLMLLSLGILMKFCQ